jgi:hypothetical protein
MDMSNSNSATPRPLAAADLCRRCDPGQFKFKTTDDLEDLQQVLGQARAVNAIAFGVGMGRDGYNMFAMAPRAGRRTIVRRYLESQAPAREAPTDWCYVYNFDTPHRPRAIALRGRAPRFRDDMARLVRPAGGTTPRSSPPSTRAKQKEIGRNSPSGKTRRWARSASARRSRASRWCARRRVSASRPGTATA